MLITYYLLVYDISNGFIKYSKLMNKLDDYLVIKN